ncbi:dihydrofolate reductase [Pelagibacterium sp. 26DY04]|uniref:dihydrofolate reductase n=1 Tax=Pelagibacterium sp. 26DY04 TaxID=2967130 RepID=UPI002815E2FA|nr:dihydrofolate reductase [Pelagibacterium sp. 26DY04]WMT85804.1 dihydrofolate reductase [Pelagibacterium sp. 26DY04]
MVRIAMIAAVGRNGAIGSDGKLPWRLPSDFAYYKRTTMGKPLIVGRKTFESIGKPLPGRSNIIVTRQKDYAPEGAEVFADLDAAIARGQEIAERDGVDEVFINGGAQIYRAAMDRADRLYITHVDAEPEGDTFFPEIDPTVWEGRDVPEVVPGEKDSAKFVARIYERR